MTKFYFLLFTAFLFLAGCRTAIKSYNKGNYEDAIELGVKKLYKNPDDSETKGLVKDAYRHAVSDHEDAIRNLSNSNDENRYEAILQEYTVLQSLYFTIRQYPAVAAMIPATDYSSYVQTYRDKSAEVHINNGDKWMEEGNKSAFRHAYREYQSALRFTANRELQLKRDDAYNAALTKIMVVPIQNYRGYNYNSSYQLQQFQSDIIRTLSYNVNNEFIKFYSEWELNNREGEPDEILEMNLGRIIIGRPYDHQTSKEVSKQVVVKETVYKPDSVVKQYATVKGRIVTTQRTSLSEAELYLTLRDVQGRILWNDRFTGQHRWQAQFTTYTGDERALSENEKSSLNQGNNNSNNMPREDDIMNELYRQMQSDLCSRLRNHFSNY